MIRGRAVLPLPVSRPRYDAADILFQCRNCPKPRTYPLRFIPSTLSYGPPPHSTLVYCFPASPCDLLRRASRLYFSPRLWSGHTSWGSENWLRVGERMEGVGGPEGGRRGGRLHSNQRLVLRLILLNGGKR